MPTLVEIGTRWGFTGRSDGSSILYGRERFLAVDLGAWLSRDPLWPVLSSHPSSYTDGRPTVLVDPLGLAPSLEDRLQCVKGCVVENMSGVALVIAFVAATLSLVTSYVASNLGSNVTDFSLIQRTMTLTFLLVLAQVEVLRITLESVPLGALPVIREIGGRAALAAKILIYGLVFEMMLNAGLCLVVDCSGERACRRGAR